MLCDVIYKGQRLGLYKSDDGSRFVVSCYFDKLEILTIPLWRKNMKELFKDFTVLGLFEYHIFDVSEWLEVQGYA